MKNTLRKTYKQLRSNLSPKQREIFSVKIYQNLISKFNLTNKNVSIFIPIEKFNEINTWHFLNNIDANFYLPVVKNKALKHIKFENKNQLKLSDWGILEPTYGQETLPSNFDIVIVPLLAYDTKGNRVGYGAGFYDGFLKDCQPNCKFIGVSFFDTEQKSIDTYPNDIPLHYCVTPKKVIQFKEK